MSQENTAHAGDLALQKLQLDGSMTRDKMRILIDMYGTPKLYDYLVDDRTTFSMFMEIMNFMAKLGDMFPKPNVSTLGAGAGSFSVNIIIPEGGAGPNRMIDVTPQAEPPPTLTLSVPSGSPLKPLDAAVSPTARAKRQPPPKPQPGLEPGPPTGIRIPDFNLIKPPAPTVAVPTPKVPA